MGNNFFRNFLRNKKITQFLEETLFIICCSFNLDSSASNLRLLSIERTKEVRMMMMMIMTMMKMMRTMMAMILMMRRRRVNDDIYRETKL